MQKQVPIYMSPKDIEHAALLVKQGKSYPEIATILASQGIVSSNGKPFHNAAICHAVVTTYPHLRQRVRKVQQASSVLSVSKPVKRTKATKNKRGSNKRVAAAINALEALGLDSTTILTVIKTTL